MIPCFLLKVEPVARLGGINKVLKEMVLASIPKAKPLDERLDLDGPKPPGCPL
jgi:hypothetical protein